MLTKVWQHYLLRIGRFGMRRFGVEPEPWRIVSLRKRVCPERCQNISHQSRRRNLRKKRIDHKCESTVSAYIANDVVPLEIGQKTTASLSVDSYSYRGLKPTNEDRVISIPDVSVLFSALESDKFKESVSLGFTMDMEERLVLIMLELICI
ncbi:hypothetical protein BC829DRAFT_195621 [Chytridium lagenaria]|nr:hypothetical protein BC829DRAFT_195621 [Chytridium lagenaria]